MQSLNANIFLWYFFLQQTISEFTALIYMSNKIINSP